MWTVTVALFSGLWQAWSPFLIPLMFILISWAVIHILFAD